jgi:hypothetical protein
MADQCFSMVRGRVMRVTRLDGCGRVKSSGCSAITSEGFVSVAFTANINEGESITVTNAAGKTCVNDPAVARIESYGLVITFCEVSPELYAMMTGQAVVFDSDGNAVGFRVNTDVDPADSGFALEVWSNVPGVVCGDAGDAGTFGYTLTPFVQGGVIGDFTIENNAVTFTVNNAITKKGGAWGAGPYDVVSDAGTPGPLLEPLGPADILHVQLTTVAPPAAGCSCAASGPAPTGATAGSPGSWTPVDSYPLADLAALVASSVTASPSTAWTAGQYIVLEDGSFAHWNGTAWVAGIA